MKHVQKAPEQRLERGGVNALGSWRVKDGGQPQKVTVHAQAWASSKWVYWDNDEDTRWETGHPLQSHRALVGEKTCLSSPHPKLSLRSVWICSQPFLVPGSL